MSVLETDSLKRCSLVTTTRLNSTIFLLLSGVNVVLPSRFRHDIFTSSLNLTFQFVNLTIESTTTLL